MTTSRSSTRSRLALPALAAMAFAGVGLGAPSTADAFCGFYVSGADADMFNNATQVVLMREGTRTALSMQNNYQGPPENFAMVVPVPVVLEEENVKTLPREIFDRVDQLAAPRLVEYWEQDPCAPRKVYDKRVRRKSGKKSKAKNGGAVEKDLGVTIEAEFTVGEYQIVILSAKDSSGLDTWLRQEKYKIPDGAEPLLRPYVQAGSKFFVAKVDVSKVGFEDGMATLSPLRFHYESDAFSLPVRLGLINSSGTQDLIVHILAKGKRYEVANYKNVTIPTNLDVKDEVRTRFGEFYAALFDATLEKNPGAVITEYSWDASTCDPCPTPALRPNELATLGADVLFGAPSAERPSSKGAKKKRRSRRPAPSFNAWGFVLTRLHARYEKGALADDLIFREAPAIGGGREWRTDDGLEHGAVPSGSNMFQGRYAIRHEWTGPIECENPRRGIWGGPPAGVDGTTKPKPALDLAFAPRGKVKLARMVARDIPELGVSASAEGPDDGSAAGDTAAGGDTATGDTTTDQTDGDHTESTGATTDPAKQKTSKGCSATQDTSPVPLLLVLLALVLVRVRRRREPAASA